MTVPFTAGLSAEPNVYPPSVACNETRFDGVDDYSIFTIASAPTLVSSFKYVCLEVNLGATFSNGFIFSLSRQATPTDGVNIAFLDGSGHGIYIDYGGASRYLSNETTRGTWLPIEISINTTRDNSDFYLAGVQQTTTFGSDNTIIPRDGMCIASQFRNPAGNEGEQIVRKIECFDVIAPIKGGRVYGDPTSLGLVADDLVFQSENGSGQDNTVGATFTLNGDPVTGPCT